MPLALLCLALLASACDWRPTVPTATPRPPTPTILPTTQPSPTALPPAVPTSILLAPPVPTSGGLAPAVPTSAAPASDVPTAVALASATADVSLPQVVLTNSQGSRVRLYVEIADTPAKEERGLMSRTTLAEDQGMLFTFASETTIPFWMKDTLLPLSIAFIKSDGRIVDIQDMQPLDERMHNPAQPYTYALEVNQGYFRRHAIAVGNIASPPR